MRGEGGRIKLTAYDGSEVAFRRQALDDFHGVAGAVVADSFERVATLAAGLACRLPRDDVRPASDEVSELLRAALGLGQNWQGRHRRKQSRQGDGSRQPQSGGGGAALVVRRRGGHRSNLCWVYVGEHARA